MQDIQVGIIGFGRIGAEHAGWLDDAADIRAVAADDVTAARRALAASRGLKTYDTLEAMVADRSIDAVLVSTPTSMHFEHAMLALESGKHVMIEKPMALDLDESRRLVQEAAERKRVISVFHNRRWDIDYLTVRQAVQSGAFGKLINVESRLGQYASCVGPAAREYHPTWRNEAAFGGGGLYDWGSHFIDQLWRLLWPARPVRVFAQLRGNVWTSDCDDFARVLIDFDNGAVGMCEINTTTSRPLPRWHLDGVAGSAWSPASLRFDTREWAQLQFVSSEASRSLEGVPLARAGMTEQAIWEQFAAAIRGKGAPAVPAESVLPTMALLDAARHSSRHQESADVQGVVDWVY
jgi:predicted dehydrogenase